MVYPGVPVWARVAVAVLAALAMVATAGPAWAGGDVAEIFRGRAGAYEITVGVLPEEPALGRVHFSVTVSDAETSQPIRTPRSFWSPWTNPESRSTSREP